MHIVYQITLPTRLSEGLFPYRYIGSKSNCTIKNGIIINRRNMPYYGSSRDDSYQSALGVDIPIVDILYTGSSYQDVLEKERDIHIERDVVADPSYFNKAIAMMNTFSDPDYATMKHVVTGKVARLKKDHPLIVAGEWVGLTRGRIIPEDERKKRGRAGELNPFYGKTFSEKSKIKARESRRKMYESERGAEIRQEASERAKRTFAGSKQSQDHIEKRKRFGLVMLKNIQTNESIRIPREEALFYDKSIWVPFGSLPQKKIVCIHCGLSGNVGNINRWHNDNCKNKPDKENFFEYETP